MLLGAILCTLACVVVVDASSSQPQAHLSLQTKARNWTDASEYCRVANGHLVYPTNQQEADEVKALMAASSVTVIHAGLHDIMAEGSYYTIQGQPTAETCYSQWAPGYPQGGPGNNCGGFTPEGLRDASCAELQAFVCKENIGPDYELIAGHGHFKYHQESLNWTDAASSCRQEGAHLWIPNSEAEVEAVLARYRYVTSWVGLHHIFVDQEFISIFDVPMAETGFSRWYPGEPSGSNQDYPYVILRTTDGYLILDWNVAVLHLVPIVVAQPWLDGGSVWM